MGSLLTLELPYHLLTVRYLVHCIVICLNFQSTASIKVPFVSLAKRGGVGRCGGE